MAAAGGTRGSRQDAKRAKRAIMAGRLDARSITSVGGESGRSPERLFAPPASATPPATSSLCLRVFV